MFNQTDLSQQPIVPISQMSPYLPRSTIRARVSAKSDKRTFNSQKTGNSGTLFSVDFVDQSGEIKATAFNDVAEHLHPLIEVGHVYLVHKPTIKFANKRYNSGHEYEMTLDANTLIWEYHDDNNEVPRNSYNFVAINQIKDKSKDDMVGTELGWPLFVSSLSDLWYH